MRCSHHPTSARRPRLRARRALDRSVERADAAEDGPPGLAQPVARRDVDDDRDVDVDDITATAQVWNASTANYNAATDVDWDGFNTLLDIQKGASQFGQSCP